jgi:hypothetical protein
MPGVHPGVPSSPEAVAVLCRGSVVSYGKLYAQCQRKDLLLLTIALKSVDLPALGGPAMATRTPRRIRSAQTLQKGRQSGEGTAYCQYLVLCGTAETFPRRGTVQCTLCCSVLYYIITATAGTSPVR